MWKYSDGWKLYIANGKNYTFSNAISDLSKINKGEGFWIKGNANCIIDTADLSTPTYTLAKPIATKNILDGWREELIYAANIIFPRQVVTDEDKNIYITVQIGKKFRIFLFNDDDTTSLFLEIDDHIQGFSYQANLKRFIYTTDNGSLYAI